SIPVGGHDRRAPRRQRAAAAGDRGRSPAGAAARVGARSGDVPEAARCVPDLPVNILLGGLLAVAAADTLWLQNDRLRLGFDPTNGSLLELADRASGQSFVDGRRATAIWRLDGLGPGALRGVRSPAARFFWHEVGCGGRGGPL